MRFVDLITAHITGEFINAVLYAIQYMTLRITQTTH